MTYPRSKYLIQVTGIVGNCKHIAGAVAIQWPTTQTGQCFPSAWTEPSRMFWRCKSMALENGDVCKPDMWVLYFVNNGPNSSPSKVVGKVLEILQGDKTPNHYQGRPDAVLVQKAQLAGPVLPDILMPRVQILDGHHALCQLSVR